MANCKTCDSLGSITITVQPLRNVKLLNVFSIKSYVNIRHRLLEINENSPKFEKRCWGICEIAEVNFVRSEFDLRSEKRMKT